ARSAASPVQPWRAPDTTCSWWTVSLRTSKRSTATGSPSSARAWARAEGGAVTPDWLGGDLSLVLLAVKSHHSAEALAVLAPRLAAAGTIVSLQNGLSEELIAQAVGAERTVGCLVNWAADWAAPGRILHGGHGAFVLGELDGRITPRVRLARAGPTPPRRPRGLRAGRAGRAHHPARARAGRAAERRRGDSGHRQ